MNNDTPAEAGLKGTIVNNSVIQTSDATFEKDVLQASLPVLVDFWAPWCAPCRMVGPVVEELAQEYSGRLVVAKVNTDDSPGISSALGIMSIPTLVIFKNGQPVDGVVGAVPKQTLKGLIEKHMAPAIVVAKG